MPITVVCPECSNRMKLKDELAGKRAKCPKCKAVITLTPIGDSQEVASGGSEGKEQWQVQTADKETYGPISKTELDQWVEEGRVDAECQLLKDGWDQWKWADDVYPQLSKNGSQPDPFAGVGGPAPAPGAAVSPSTGGFPGVDAGGSSGPGGFPAVETKGPSFGPVQGPAPTSGGFPAPSNPYQSPASGGIGASGDASSPGILQAMESTRLWVLILMIIGGIILALALLGLMVGLIQVIAFPPAIIFWGFQLVTVIAGPGVSTFLLFQYWSHIGTFLMQRSASTLEAALQAQRNIYLYMVIYIVGSFLLMIVMFVIMIVAGVALFSAVAGQANQGGGPPPWAR